MFIGLLPFSSCVQVSCNCSMFEQSHSIQSWAVSRETDGMIFHGYEREPVFGGLPLDYSVHSHQTKLTLKFPLRFSVYCKLRKGCATLSFINCSLHLQVATLNFGWKIVIASLGYMAVKV